MQAGNWSNYALVIVPEFCIKWSGTGQIVVNQDHAQIIATPAGLGSTTMHLASAGNVAAYRGHFSSLAGTTPHGYLSFRFSGSGAGDGHAGEGGIGSMVGVSTAAAETPTALQSQLDSALRAEEARYAAYGDLADTKAAVPSSVLWLTVWEHYTGGGFILTISRGGMGDGPRWTTMR